MNNFSTHTFDNGLTVIAEIDPAAHTAAIGYMVKAGTRDEPLELMGVSHFLEHMMFKGTPRRSADDVNREFDEIGANYNAFTNHEVTTYYAHVLPEFLPRATDLLSDMLRPSLHEADFDMEKNVILEEIGMYMDHPFWVAYEHTAADYYADHPLGYRVLGTNESITALTADQMKGYFDHHYSPDNIVVSLAGQIDLDATLEQLSTLCASWQRTGATRTHGSPAAHTIDRTEASEKVTRHYITAFSAGPSQQSDDRYAASVLSYVLGDSDGSLLYWNLVAPGLADEAEISHHAQDQTGTFLAYASCDPARAEEVEALLFKTIDTTADQLNDDMVVRARTKIATGLTLQNERPMGRMLANATDWTYTASHEPLEDKLAKLAVVTKDDLVNLLKTYPTDIRAITRLTPAAKA